MTDQEIRFKSAYDTARAAAVKAEARYEAVKCASGAALENARRTYAADNNLSRTLATLRAAANAADKAYNDAKVADPATDSYRAYSAARIDHAHKILTSSTVITARDCIREDSASAADLARARAAGLVFSRDYNPEEEKLAEAEYAGNRTALRANPINAYAESLAAQAKVVKAIASCEDAARKLSEAIAIRDARNNAANEKAVRVASSDSHLKFMSLKALILGYDDASHDAEKAYVDALHYDTEAAEAARINAWNALRAAERKPTDAAYTDASVIKADADAETARIALINAQKDVTAARDACDLYRERESNNKMMTAIWVLALAVLVLLLVALAAK